MKPNRVALLHVCTVFAMPLSLDLLCLPFAARTRRNETRF